uniref:SGS domain-containing protein n=1 Tax=Eubacterium cellulosolvens (strain ATCC 43171 / JCM 9499 / 6) TaxID=633697 RepID=I5AT90_EUBC6
MNRIHNRNKVMICIMAMIMMTFSGCSFFSLNSKWISRKKDNMISTSAEVTSRSRDQGESSYWDNLIGDFIKALDKHDKALLRGCFSEYVRENDTDLDYEITKLFESYDGPTDSWEWEDFSSQSFSNDPGENREYKSRRAILRSHGKNYYFEFEYTTIDLNKSGRDGLCCVDFTTPEVQAAISDGRSELTDYKPEINWDESDHYRLHVTTEHRGEYQTRRIDGRETIYTSSEVNYASNDFMNLIKENRSVKVLKEKFGSENAGLKNSQMMYYKVTDGEDLYVCIYYMDGNEGEEVRRVELVNEEKHVKTLFLKE